MLKCLAVPAIFATAQVFVQPRRWAEAFWPATFSNWALVIVGTIAGGLAWRTLNQIKDQARSGRDAATAALLNAQAVINAERAWILAQLESDTNLPGPICLTNHPPETTAVLKLICRNEGKSPAWIDNVYGRMDVVSSRTEIRDNYERHDCEDFGSMEPIGAAGVGSRSLELNAVGMVGEGSFLSTFVIVDYHDIFGKSRTTTLVGSFTGAGRRTAIAPRSRNS